MYLKNEVLSREITDSLSYSNSKQPIEEIFEKYNIKLLDTRKTNSALKNLSCFRWAMRTIGLEQYANEAFEKYNVIPLNQNIPELELSEKIELQMIVAYKKDKNSKYYSHIGILSHIEDNEIIVISMWGKENLLVQHKITNVPDIYGHYVDFYRKV